MESEGSESDQRVEDSEEEEMDFSLLSTPHNRGLSSFYFSF